MTTSDHPNILLVTLRHCIPFLKLSITFMLLAGLCVWTSQDVLAQANGLSSRVSELERRVDEHDAQLVELHSSVATIGAQATASLKLVGTDLQNTDVELTPTPLSNGRSRYLSDTLAKVLVPASAARTHLLMVTGASYGWHQAISNQAYQCSDAVFISFKSAALTNAGLSSDTISVAVGTDQQFDEAASTVGVTRGKDPLWTLGWDTNLFAAFLNGTIGPSRATINGEPITDAQALQIATTVMHSPMEIQVKARATTRSVDSFTVSQGTIQVWADGN